MAAADPQQTLINGLCLNLSGGQRRSDGRRVQVLNITGGVNQPCWPALYPTDFFEKELRMLIFFSYLGHPARSCVSLTENVNYRMEKRGDCHWKHSRFSTDIQMQEP